MIQIGLVTLVALVLAGTGWCQTAENPEQDALKKLALRIRIEGTSDTVVFEPVKIYETSGNTSRSFWRLDRGVYVEDCFFKTAHIEVVRNPGFQTTAWGPAATVQGDCYEEPEMAALVFQIKHVPATDQGEDDQEFLIITFHRGERLHTTTVLLDTLEPGPDPAQTLRKLGISQTRWSH